MKKQGNLVPSIDINNPIFIKSIRDTRKNKKWEQVTDFQWVRNRNYWILKTDRYGWELISDCIIKQNGVETDNEQPICDICKREKATTMKGTCETCYPYV